MILIWARVLLHWAQIILDFEVGSSLFLPFWKEKRKKRDINASTEAITNTI